LIVYNIFNVFHGLHLERVKLIFLPLMATVFDGGVIENRDKYGVEGREANNIKKVNMGIVGVLLLMLVTGVGMLDAWIAK
jgi:hypothetical protein